jgi:hypothetical protein
VADRSDILLTEPSLDVAIDFLGMEHSQPLVYQNLPECQLLHTIIVVNVSKYRLAAPGRRIVTSMLRSPNATIPANGTISAAREIFAEAMIQQGIYNKYRFDHPRRNRYKPGQRVPLRRRDAGEPGAPHLDSTVLAASALVAEHDVKAEAVNGTLHKSYPPLSHKADEANDGVPTSGPNEK